MFQIYLPAVQNNREAALVAAGLGDLLADAFWTEGPGPDGGYGVFASWRRHGQTSRSGYHPELQRWIPAVADRGQASGRYSVGLWNSEPLSPGTLARRRLLAGTQLVLTESGEPWLLPSVSLFPRSMKQTEDGLLLVVKGDLRPFAQWAGELAATVSRTGSINQQQLFDFCTAALRLNYCLTTELVGELELITTETAPAIFKAVLGGEA